MNPQLLAARLVTLVISVTAFASTLVAQELTGIEAALPAIRQLNDPVALLSALNGAAMQKMQAGDVEKAITYIDESISIARKHGDAALLQGPLMTATMILNKASPDRATKFLLSVLNGEQGKPEIERAILQRLGEHLQRSGDIVAAIQVFHDFQLKCKQQDPKSDVTAWALLQYGQACLNGRMFDLAQPALTECKQLSEEIGRNEIAAICSASLGNACLGTEQYEVAANLFLAQLESAKKAKDESQAYSAIVGLVMALIGDGKFDDAQQVLQNNIPDSKGFMKGELLGLQSILHLVDGSPDKALKASQDAASEKLAALPFISRAMVSSQTIMHDRLKQSYIHYQLDDNASCLKAAGQAMDGYEKVKAQITKAAAMGAEGLDSALTGYSSTLASISEIRQQAFVDDRKLEQAFLESESSRGQAQIEAMKKLFQASGSELSENDITIEQIKALASENGVTFVEFSVVNSIDFQTRSVLGAAGDKFDAQRVLAWIVQPSGQIEFVDLMLPLSVQEIVSKVRAEVAPPKPGQSAKPSEKPAPENGENRTEQRTQEKESSEAPASGASTKYQRLAYDLLWKPIAEYLPADAKKQVVVIPDAELYALPFATLLANNEKPLIETHTLSMAGSIELYRLALARRKAIKGFDGKQVLVVGNPEMPKYKFRPDKPPAPLDPLPGSEKEANTIAGMFGIEPLIGKDATESAVKTKMQTAPVIHMATHGLLEADSVFTRNYLSSMALAADAKSDGFLTVREVMAMELDAELAVLSACDSGRGKITGDGVVGLSRAYLSAGVPNVVVSLWPVSDQATAFMMVQFYNALGKGESKTAALRTAIPCNAQRSSEPRDFGHPSFCMG